MNIVLGITAGIAAYKTPQLVRLLTKKEHNVKVILTENAKEFVTPLTLSTVSKSPVLTNFSSPEGNWHSHVELALWADAMLIAPATANTIAKMAHGVCDNLLLATYFSAKAPVFIAPAMDLDMYAHPSTQANIDRLRQVGNIIIEPQAGFLASGLEGKGRMEEPENIVATLEKYFEGEDNDRICTAQGQLAGKKVLITAGPTYEKIDPVRFIGNYSSGKMGFALAEACARRGAKVRLITGPVSLKVDHPHILRTDVESADEMYELAVSAFSDAEIAILSAAVADYRPAEQAAQKIKREGQEVLSLSLVRNRDIAATLGEKKRTGQYLVGFALETNDGVAHAKEKLTRKHLDMIVLNSLREEGAGFACDTNKITVIDREGQMTDFPLKDKKAVADDILDCLKTLITKR